jgi:hypothetical protein
MGPVSAPHHFVLRRARDDVLWKTFAKPSRMRTIHGFVQQQEAVDGRPAPTMTTTG